MNLIHVPFRRIQLAPYLTAQAAAKHIKVDTGKEKDRDKDWKAEKYQALPKSILNTYHFQNSLPKLPIPKLELTGSRYLDSIKCIQSNEEHQRTISYWNEFSSKDGLGLNKVLIHRNKQLKGTSYITAPWFDMYLSDRKPLPIHYNPALVFVEDEKIDSLPKEKRQVIRATNFVISSLRFMKSLEQEILDPEVFHLNPSKSDHETYRKVMKYCPQFIATYASYLYKAFPLDMSQYNNLFSSTRIPKFGKDLIVRGKSNSSHIIVMRKGHFYECPVLDENGYILPPSEILDMFYEIVNDDVKVNENPLGTMTTQERNKWANIREHLISLSQKNLAAIQSIDSSIFVLCLDDVELGPEPPIVTKSFLHSDGKNRWFDKSFQMILSKDGWAGVTFEHAWGDGVAVLRFFNEIHKDVKDKCWTNTTEPTESRFKPKLLGNEVIESNFLAEHRLFSS